MDHLHPFFTPHSSHFFQRPLLEYSIGRFNPLSPRFAPDHSFDGMEASIVLQHSVMFSRLLYISLKNIHFKS